MKQQNKNRLIRAIALTVMVSASSGTVWAEETEFETEIAAVNEEYGIATLELIDGQIFPDSGYEYLEASEVENLPVQLLAYARYEILARYGVLFDSPELSGYFGKQSWYFGFLPEEEFPESMLNEYDLANLEFLLQQERNSGITYQLDQPGYNYNVVSAYLAGEDMTEYLNAQTLEETEIVTEAEEESEIIPEESEAQEQPEQLPEETEVQEQPEQLPEETEAQEQTETVLEEEPETEVQEVPEDHPEPASSEKQGLDLSGNSDVSEEIWNGSMESMDIPAQQMQVNTASEYIFPDADSRYLSQREVDALSLQAICYAKNEIYARHGRKFVSKELQEYFGSKSWYNGTVEPEAFSDRVFNDFELQNVQILVGTELSINPAGYPLDQTGYDIHAVGTASAADVLMAMTGNVVSDEEYLSRDYIFADSDMRQLTTGEVNVLSAVVASYAVNEIYARRGCIFESQQVQRFFEQKPWYSGRIAQAAFSEGLFNQIELYNINLLLQRRSALMR